MRLRGQIKDDIERNADDCSFSCEERELVTLYRAMAGTDKQCFLHVGKVLAARAQQAGIPDMPQSDDT